MGPCDEEVEVEKELRMRWVGKGSFIGAAGRNRLNDIVADGEIDKVDVDAPGSSGLMKSPIFSSRLGCEARELSVEAVS